MIVTALVSYGMSGEVFHAPLINAHPGFRMKTILQRNSDTAKQHYPSVHVARTLDEILHDPEIELVIVNSINQTHFHFAAKALLAGKHVVVEKPFTNTTSEAAELIRLSAETRRVLSVFHNRRWDGSFLTLQKILASGALGRIVEFEAHYDRYRPSLADSWKEVPNPGSGILYNLGSHMLDQVLVLFGNPISVSAKTGAQRTGSLVDDFYDVRLEYPGINVIVKSSYLVREPGPQYRVNGVNGSFVKMGIDPQEEALKLKQTPGGPGWGTEPENFWGRLNTEQNGVHINTAVETLSGDYSAYYTNLFEAIREGKELAVKPEEALLVIKLIEACLKSSRERKIIMF